MLDVGVDSYVSLEEANTIASCTNLSSDKAYQNWLNLSDNDKEVLLRNSCRAIDNLKFNGRRKNLGQVLEFPRVESSYSGLGYRLYISQLYDNGLYSGGSSDGGVSLVKQAQVINAVFAGYYNDLATDQIGVSIQGLTSKKAGPISETYNRNNSNNGISNADALKGIFTEKVYSLLTPWLNEARISF